jgi:hypothetical protein
LPWRAPSNSLQKYRSKSRKTRSCRRRSDTMPRQFGVPLV